MLPNIYEYIHTYLKHILSSTLKVIFIFSIVLIDLSLPFVSSYPFPDMENSFFFFKNWKDMLDKGSHEGANLAPLMKSFLSSFCIAGWNYPLFSNWHKVRLLI